MRQRVGVIALAAVLALSACSTTTNQTPNGIPAPVYAPIASVTGTIPAEAGAHGVLTGVAFTMMGGDSPDSITFSEPAIPFEFDANGAFNVVLPAAPAGGYPDAPPLGSCDFSGHAFVGMILAFEEPVSNPAPSEGLRAVYGWRAGEVVVFAWYSPTDSRLQCENSERSNFSGGLLERWDLRLRAGWNQAVMLREGERVYFRSGAAEAAAWVSPDAR